MKIHPGIGFISVSLWVGLLNPPQAATIVDSRVLQVLNRLSFGPRPGDIQTVTQLGVERYIQQQLHPDAIPESPTLSDRLSQLDTLNLTPAELLSQYDRRQLKGQKPTPEDLQAYREKVRSLRQQMNQARLLRATQSDRQLQEVMVNFWYNHFNVYAGKGIDRVLVGAYEQQAIRPFVLGRFRDLVAATAKHPAMLFYLDNWQNSTPKSANARGRFQGLNENYARELMELHTLGVEGGYSQQDVISLAKILTGWTFRRQGQVDNFQTNFYFDAKRHDFSDKAFLGYKIHGQGMAEGEQALDILAKSPATARHISYELAQYFVSDRPPQMLVDRLSKRFLATDGNIREVLNTLFHSPEFWSPQAAQAKFKTPYEYAISAIRATGIEVSNFTPINNLLQQLGMPLYGCQTPDGYKNTQDFWLNPDAMTRRLSFATALASGKLPLLAVQPKASTTRIALNGSSLGQLNPVQAASSPLPIQPLNPDELKATLGNRFSPKTQQAIASTVPPLRAALILGSPEFMHR